jgi:hypothetical protein
MVRHKRSIESCGRGGGFWVCPLSPSKPVIAFWGLWGQPSDFDGPIIFISVY